MSKRIFIDLGENKGKAIIKALKIYPHKERHDNLVKKLQDLGFEITGDSVEDQFCHGV